MSESTVSVRDAEIGDAYVLALLSRRCFKKSPEWFVPLFLVRRWWRGVIEHDGCVVRVAIDHGGVFGYALSVYAFEDWDWVSSHGAHARWMKGAVTLLRPSFLKSYIAKRKKAKAQSRTNQKKRADSETVSDPVGRVSVREILGDRGVYWAIVAVSPEAQGRGVGKALLEGVTIFGQNAKADRICLHVDPRNKGAQGLYAKYGYALAGRDGNSLLMVKTLSDEPKPGL
jgi:ribosomal protein S18 acetylase RimI-like enzyme